MSGAKERGAAATATRRDDEAPDADDVKSAAGGRHVIGDGSRASSA